MFIQYACMIESHLYDYSHGVSKKRLYATWFVDISDSFSLIHKLRSLHPKDFEEFIAYLFQLSEYTIISQNQRKKCYGNRMPYKECSIDMVTSIHNKKVYVQLKRYVNHQVETLIVKDFYNTIKDSLRDDDYGMIITTSMLSDEALRSAYEKDITVLEYSHLIRIVHDVAKHYHKEIQKKLNSLHTDSPTPYDNFTKTCPSCYAPVIKRKRAWSQFYGCMNHHRGNCQYTV